MTLIFVLCLNMCIYQVPSPLYCIINLHDFKGWGENQRIMLHDKPKTWFLTLTSLLKMACLEMIMLTI